MVLVTSISALHKTVVSCDIRLW